MVRLGTIALLLLSALGLTAQTGSRPIELQEIVHGRFAARGAGQGMRSLPDGEHYTLMSSDRSAILRYSFATGQLVDTLFSVSQARECSFKSFDDYQIAPSGHHILLYTEQRPIYRRSSDAVVFHYDVRRRLVRPLSEQGGRMMIPTFSPDGRMVAFVRDNNIFIKKFDFDTEVQVTTDGRRNAVLHGVTDWVYEEEFEVTRQLSWSEDGQFLAWVRSDESAVPEYRMPMYGSRLYPEDYVYKYPKAGEANSIVSVHLYNVQDRSTRPIKLSSEEAYYIPRIAFIDRGSTLAVMTLNRLQNHFRMIYVNGRSLIARTILDERSDTYIDAEQIQQIQFTPTGFAMLSDRSGYVHLYHFDDRGQLQRQVTSGQWDIDTFYGMDAAGNAYYQAADEHPTRRSILKTDTRGQQTRLGAGRGSNGALFAQGFRYYINSFSTLTEPTRTDVYRTEGNRLLRTLEDNAMLRERLTQYSFAPKELMTLHTDSGLELNAWIVRPRDFDPTKRYPLVMLQYSGPGSQLVRDSFGFGWEYYLAGQGFVVACVDGRGTGARGSAWRKGTYMQLGLQESADQAAAARALGQLSYIDRERIAIWGWSFGGYNALMSLIHGSGVFKLGIAVAPVTDWRYYDTIYTERFMRTPQENPRGYEATSVVAHADRLRGRLLLIHGSADDNVHLQNTMDVAARLVEAGIPFDEAIYTDRDHSIAGRNTRLHLYTRMAQYLRDHL